MRAKTDTKNRIYSFLDQLSALGLKLSVPVTVLAVGYLAFIIFGNRISDVDKLSQVDRAYLLNSLRIVMQTLSISASALVFCLIIRLFYNELVGQTLSVIGGVLSFGSPSFFINRMQGQSGTAGRILADMAGEFVLVGVICMLPGLTLLVRDGILRIWRCIEERRTLEIKWGDEEERKQRPQKQKMYCKCWDMLYCRKMVRDVCPAYKARKSCWRVKTGCFCDENIILKALASQGSEDNTHYKGILHALGLDQPASPGISAKAKRARCRRCNIYAEHQRQKYRLFSAMVFPAVGLGMYVLYKQIHNWIYVALASADKFVSFLASKSIENYAAGSGNSIMTNLAIVWLGIILVSYTLRTLEYLIFDLQV